MKVAVLGSGSGGNAAVIKARDTTMLVDAGLSARQLGRRLEQIGVDPDSLDGILLTHEHRDHTCGLEVFLRRRSTPVFTTALTRETLGDRITDSVDWRIFQHGQVFNVGEVAVEAFALPHDAVDPVGFVCRSGNSCIGVATDFGFVTNLVRDRLKGVHALLVEANYDDKMLDADSKRPWSIKQRISSRHGHLSNLQTADLVEGLLDHGLKTVILGHLSSDCNCPDVAVSAIREIESAKGMERQLGVHVASQAEPTSWVEIRGEEAEECSAPATMNQMDLAIGTHL
ncbi:MAG: metal-dependent hydrolase [Roseibacillus sp.]|nr:metal-dependent hydrolase [Roseibacillus sp.]